MVLIPSRIIAIDGEGIREDGRHHYVHLAASDAEGFYREITTSRGGLSPHAIYEFLLALPDDATLVIYGGSYDFTQWMVGTPRFVWTRLHEQGCTIIRTGMEVYQARMLPNRKFSISRYRQIGTTRSIYDVLGFFQKTFVQTLETWQVLVGPELERMADMKARRNAFTRAELAEIIPYCRSELDMLVHLTRKLMQACEKADLIPRYWMGAGQLGGAWLEKHKAKAFIGDPPEFARLAIYTSYSGGRIDVVQTGEYDDVHLADINSAYPDAIRYLPCTTHMETREVDGKTMRKALRDPNTRAIVRIRWKDIPGLWPPFWVRQEDGTICYPPSGVGWYHSVEARHPLKILAEYCEVEGGIIFVNHCPPDCRDEPFKIIEDCYRLRKEWAKIDEMAGAAYVLKLAMNSVYGKMAQTVGWQDQAPPYRALIWAGMITAHCRAKVWQAIQQAPDQVISCATDGIISKVRLDLTYSGSLGEWDYKHADHLRTYQPGIYEWWQDGEEHHKKNRGFKTTEIDWEDLYETIILRGKLAGYEYENEKLMNIGATVHRTDAQNLLGQWIPQTRHIALIQHQRKTLDMRTLPGRDKQIRWLPSGYKSSDKSSSHPFIKQRKYTDLRASNAPMDENSESDFH